MKLFEKKGVTIYEAVVAMTVMVIIIMMVTTIIGSSILVKDKVREKVKASLLSNSVVEVYKVNKDEFLPSLEEIYDDVTLVDEKIYLKKDGLKLVIDTSSGLLVIAYDEKDKELLRYQYDY